MTKILSTNSITNGKLISFSKVDIDKEQIQLFLKDLGIKKDYRKKFLKGELFDDRWDSTSTKENDIIVSAFITKNKVLIQVIYLKNELQNHVLSLLGKNFS